MKSTFLTSALVIIVLGAASNLAAKDYEVTRLCGGPILTAEHFAAVGAPEADGANINGPTLIRVPDWLEPARRADPRARYYLYFAHHKGDFLRLAWAAEPCGPWRLYGTGAGFEVGKRGVLDLGVSDELEIGNGLKISDHLASPEIVVDGANRRFVLFFHAPAAHDGKKAGQKTFAATSPDGLDFNGAIEPVMLGRSYFRVFAVRNHLYAIANNAVLYRAPDAGNPWTPPPDFDFSTELWSARVDPLITVEVNPRGGPMLPRHSWVRPQADMMVVFFTRVGDVPERIVITEIDIRDDDYRQWQRLTPAAELLRAELTWEGADLEPEPSLFDWAPEPANQLRDPFVFEEDGRLYLLYTGAGEKAIGLATLLPSTLVPGT
jgi:hypothetical protein